MPVRRLWSSIIQTSTKRTTPSARRLEQAARLTLELLEDRTLLSGGPVLSLSQTAFSVVKTTQLVVTASATENTSGQTLTFSLANQPTGANISSTQLSPPHGSAATGTLTWTPTLDQGPTSYTFTITVTDSNAKSASQTVTVTTLAAGLVGNNLLIVGTSGNDTVSVSAPTSANAISVTVNGATTGPFTVPSGGQIQANLFAGNDSFTVNESPVKVGPVLVVDGGTGTNTLTDNGTSGADQYTITGSKVSLVGAGDLQYTNFQSLAVNTLAGNDSVTLTGINPATATAVDGGADTNTFTGNVAGSFSGSLTLTNFQNATMQAGGDFGGSLTVNAPSGLQQLTVPGTVTAGSSIQAANLSNVTIGTLAGQVIATTGSVVGANITNVAATGLLQATEVAGVPGSGQLNNVTVNTLSGTLLAGSISGLNVTHVNTGGVIKAAGQGTASNVSIGTNDGSFTAAPDPTDPNSGTMSNTTIGTNNGDVSTGSISGMSVTTNSGSITAAGQGTTSNVSVGTNDGSFTAVEDPNVPGSGTMSNTTIGTNNGDVSTGSISGMSVTTNSGSITAAGQGTTSNVSIGTNDGSFTAAEDPTDPNSGTMSNTTIGTNNGDVSTGTISTMSVTTNSGSITAAGRGSITGINIGSLSGTLAAMADTTPGSGALNNALIGTLTTTGRVLAATAANLTVTTVGGAVHVSNTLTNFSAGTVLATANLTAGHFNVATAQHASPVVNFIEPTVTRTLALTPHTGTSVPDYGFYYDGTSSSSDPKVVVQINTATPVSFDLGVTTSTSTSANAGFDLAGLYAVNNAQTGVHNVVVGGNLLLGVGVVPAGAISLFQLPASTLGGVQLPNDSLAVAIAGNAPAGSIAVKAISAIAAGSFGTVSADSAGNSDAFTPLVTGTAVIQANDNYRIFVSEANHVAQFLVTGPGGSFDNKKMLFADQVNDNRPVTATDFLVPSGSSTAVNEVDFTGKGGSLTTAQPILATIKGASGASLGDLILSSPGGITANITADTIIGNIDSTNGGISSVIQTTVGDLGRALTGTSGNITGVTFIHAGGGGLTSTGKIISAGNLVSLVNLKSGLDGVVFAFGDIGVIQLTNGLAPRAPAALTRFGGIAVTTGGLTGEVVALGNVFGDINVGGGLSGRIGVRGREEFGLSAGQSFSRTGILGNVSIGGGIATTGVIVSAGLIGDDGSDNISNDSAGTHLTISGNDRGIIAAEEDINFGSTGSLNASGIFENVGTPGSPQYNNGVNKSAIDNIFANPADMNQILSRLLALTVTTDAHGNPILSDG
jgi:hypothetical protein